MSTLGDDIGRPNNTGVNFWTRLVAAASLLGSGLYLIVKIIDSIGAVAEFLTRYVLR